MPAEALQGSGGLAPRGSWGWIFFLQPILWDLCTPCSGRGAGLALQAGDVWCWEARGQEMLCGAGSGPQLRCWQRDPFNWHTPKVQTRYRNGLVVGRSAPAVLRGKVSCSSACLHRPGHAGLELLQVSKPNGGGGQ